MAEATFRLKVISTNKVFYDDEAVCLVIWNRDGQRAFLAHHEKMICAVDAGEIDVKKPDGTWLECAVGAGVLEVRDNVINVVLDFAELADEIDEIRAQEAAERARERLRYTNSRLERLKNEAALARAISRITFKGKHNT